MMEADRQTIAAFEVLAPGLLTTVQDQGRRAARDQGFARGGGADRLCAALANALVGNEPSAPLLECTINGPHLRARSDVVVALTGADMDPQVDGVPVSGARAFSLKSGSILKINTAKTGARAYLGVAGGFEAALFFGARGTDLRNSGGGLHGRALIADDQLRILADRACAPMLNHDDVILAALAAKFSHDWVLRVVPGPECPPAGSALWQQLFGAAFTVSRDSDRMGVRLLAPEPAPEGTQHLRKLDYSSAVYPGTVQWPPGGEPYLLGCDGQTMGGYPRVAQVISIDLSLIAQLRPGDRVWLRGVTMEQAREMLRIRTAIVQGVLPGFSFL